MERLSHRSAPGSPAESRWTVRSPVEVVFDLGKRSPTVHFCTNLASTPRRSQRLTPLILVLPSYPLSG